MKRTCVILIGFISIFSVDVSAQDKKENSGTYVKFGIVHSQGSIEWADYVLNGFSIEVENHFEDKHLGLSGWSVGYRKDDFKYAEFGHMLNFDTFRVYNLKVGKIRGDIKFGGGIEWGMPAHKFSHTKFNNGTGADISYSHVFLNTNSNIPGVGTRNDGVLYPFAKLSLARRSRSLFLEGGMRLSIMKFGIDEYSVSSDKLIVVTRDRRMTIPSVFVSIGLGIG